jgi:hypothetical protein
MVPIVEHTLANAVPKVAPAAAPAAPVPAAPALDDPLLQQDDKGPMAPRTPGGKQEPFSDITCCFEQLHILALMASTIHCDHSPAAAAFLEIHDGLDFMLPARADNSSAVL